MTLRTELATRFKRKRLALASRTKTVNSLPTGARVALTRLVNIIDAELLGLIGIHQGKEAMAKASAALNAAKSYLFDDQTEASPTRLSQDGLLQCYVPEFLEDQDDFSEAAEWQWIEQIASFSHREAAEHIVYAEGKEDKDIPEALRPVFELARSRKITWVLFHIG